MTHQASSMMGFPIEVAANVPLRCNICTKKPSFSDLSHLLTHIASKSHLSAYYKTKVKSIDDAKAHQIIEEYDTWYTQWNIQNHMSERMNVKEAKKTQKARQGGGRATNAHKIISDQSTLALDPLLQDNSIDIRTDTGDLGTLDDGLAHRYQPWPPYSSIYNIMLDRDDFMEGEDDDVIVPDSPMQAANDRRMKRAAKQRRNKIEAPDAWEDDSADYSKLKGVLWPGMDMFDSATPNMRRKRNQKKPIDVLDRLEAASRGIEATEIIYSAAGIRQKARVITGFPNSSSPIKGEPSPIHAPRMSRRKTLASISNNTVTKPTSRTKSTPQPGAKVSRTRSGRTLNSQSVPRRRPKKALEKELKVEPEPEPEACVIQAVSNDEHDDLHYLTSAFNPQGFHASFPVNPISHFRPLDWSYYGPVPQYIPHQPNLAISTFMPGHDNEASILTAWDFGMPDHGSSLVNPLFMDNLSPDRDDRGNILMDGIIEE